MKKIISKKILLILGLTLLIALPQAAWAQIGNGTWSDRISSIWNSPSIAPDAAVTICGDIFSGDQNNIFQDVFCSLTRIIAASVSGFATETACNIQNVSYRSNYQQQEVDISFQNNGICNVPLAAVNTPSELTRTIISASPDHSYVQRTFEVTRNLLSVLALIALFVVAFANILHINIETYATKKALPAIIIAVVGAWLSIYVIYILSFIVDLTYQLRVLEPAQALNPIQNIFGGAFAGFTPDANNSVSLVYRIGQKVTGGVNFAGGFLGILFLGIPAMIVFVFEYVLALRPFIVGILTAMAPLAFACLIFPQTQIVFRKWWTYLLIALLYAPIVNLFFYFLNLLPSSSVGNNLGIIEVTVLWLFKTAVIVFLIRLPFTIESDTRKIVERLSRTQFGATLGLSRLTGRAGGQKQPTRPLGLSDRILSTQAAQKIIATTAPRSRFARGVEAIKTPASLGRGQLPNFAKIFDAANLTNLKRPENLLVRSLADLPAEAFKKTLVQSNLKIWQSPALLRTLQSAGGQVLNEEGAALRADSARKVARLAQVVEHGKIANPLSIKLLALKGTLDFLPQPLIKKSLDEGVIKKVDLLPTFKGNTEKVYQRIIAPSGTAVKYSNTKEAQRLMVRDHGDYTSGFKDLSNLFADVLRNPQITPPPPPATIRSIIGEIRRSDPMVFERSGEYFLKRLGEKTRDAHQTIASTLTQAGTSPATAVALAKNPRLDLGDAKKYLPEAGRRPENLALLREGFLNRDLANNLTLEISRLVSERKTVVGKGVTEKIAGALKETPEVGLPQIKNDVQIALQKLSKPLSPQDWEETSKAIDKYYPGAPLKGSGAPTEEEVERTRERGAGIIETIDDLNTADVTQEVLADNPAKAKEVVGKQINQNIQKIITGEIASDAKFNEELGELAVPTEEKPKG